MYQEGAAMLALLVGEALYGRLQPYRPVCEQHGTEGQSSEATRRESKLKCPTQQYYAIGPTVPHIDEANDTK
jgi:hypothetical protein